MNTSERDILHGCREIDGVVLQEHLEWGRRVVQGNDIGKAQKVTATWRQAPTVQVTSTPTQ
jgi:hypothetical protein